MNGLAIGGLLARWKAVLCVEFLFRRSQWKGRAPEWRGMHQHGRLFVDISVIGRGDSGTGIQRLVRQRLDDLMQQAGASGRPVIPVMATRTQGYREIAWSNGEGRKQAGAPMEPREGDHFFGLDFCPTILPAHIGALMRWRRLGVGFCFVFYDILPLTNPEWFTRRSARAFRLWLRCVALLAGEVETISNTSGEALLAWLEDAYRGRPPAIRLSRFPVDIAMWLQAMHGPEAPSAPPVSRPYYLTVGTIEPRKGHAPLLDAFEMLWAGGSDTVLVIAGRSGWKTRTLQARILAHPEHGRKLIWYPDADDGLLGSLYGGARAIVLPSMGEGLGLPFLEAQAFGRPVIARDLPVYGEPDMQMGDVSLFPLRADAGEIADYIMRWERQREPEPLQPRR